MQHGFDVAEIRLQSVWPLRAGLRAALVRHRRQIGCGQRGNVLAIFLEFVGIKPVE